MNASQGDGATARPKKKQGSHPQRMVPTLTIISHPNPMRMGDRAHLLSLGNGYAVPLSRTTPDFSAPGRFMGKPLEDPFISRSPILFQPDGLGGVRLDPGEGRTQIETVSQFSGLHFSRETLARGVWLTLAGRVVLWLHLTPPQMDEALHVNEIIGHSHKVNFLRQEIGRVADLETPVLLQGPSGTGKELTARAIHQTGASHKPFVSVNLGAIPPNLAASELFGAVKGSFTGADRHQLGFFKSAEGGTLFLDEVGEAPPEVQVMLLRALETGEITPVGAQKSMKISVRIISATDANLESDMETGSFKTPLFHRLAGYEISLPSLVERLDDFGRLFLHFARMELAAINEVERLRQKDPYADPWIPAHLMVVLLNYDWPGNIRQLRNVVRQLIIGCRGDACLHITPKVSQMLTRTSSLETAPLPEAEPPRVKRNPAHIQASELERVMRENRWDIKRSAEQLGIARGTLYKLIDKTEGLHRASDLPGDQILACMNEHEQDTAAAAFALRVSEGALRQRLKVLG